jgi:hypothetical protein
LLTALLLLTGLLILPALLATLLTLLVLLLVLVVLLIHDASSFGLKHKDNEQHGGFVPYVKRHELLNYEHQRHAAFDYHGNLQGFVPPVTSAEHSPGKLARCFFNRR